jgi:hypothetical protein
MFCPGEECTASSDNLLCRRTLHTQLDHDRRTVSVAFAKSMSDHRSPQSSPRRHPVVAATKSKAALSGSVASSVVIRRPTSSTLGGSISFDGNAWRGGSLGRGAIDPSPLHRLAQGSRQSGMAEADVGGGEPAVSRAQ